MHTYLRSIEPNKSDVCTANNIILLFIVQYVFFSFVVVVFFGVSSRLHCTYYAMCLDLFPLVRSKNVQRQFEPQQTYIPTVRHTMIEVFANESTEAMLLLSSFLFFL